MSYEASPFNGRRGPNRYRGGSSDARDFPDSGSRKRFRDNGILGPPQVPTDDSNRRGYEFYHPNEQFMGMGYPNDFRRSRQGDYKYRSNSRHTREMDYDFIPKRGRGDDHILPKPSRILGAFGLASRTEEGHLFNIMKKYGEIEQVKILRDTVSSRSRGFGFIYFQSIEGARAARLACASGLELHGKVVRVDYSFTKGPYNPTPGRYLGREKRQPSRPDMGRRMEFDDRRRSPMFPHQHHAAGRSPPGVRHRRPLGQPDFYRKSQHFNNSRSRSPPIHHNHYNQNNRNRMNKAPLDMHSYRSREGRNDMMRGGMHFDRSRSSKNDLMNMDRSPAPPPGR